MKKILPMTYSALKRSTQILTATLVAVACVASHASDPKHIKGPKPMGVFLQNISWVEAKPLLNEDTVVVIPLGAANKEHGPHLPLSNDFITAEYLAKRVAQARKIVVAPTVNYNYYPYFVDYPGTTSLRLETARDLAVDICMSFKKFGVKKFYFLNTGFVSQIPLKAAQEILIKEGLVMRYTDNQTGVRPEDKVIEKICTQTVGTHADEVETSMTLYFAPECVDMKRAVKDIGAIKPGFMTPDPMAKEEGRYSPTGVFGDPTLATKAKGKAITEAMIEGMLREIDYLQAFKN